MIAVERLTRRFGSKTAVDKVSFEVGPGEVLGFLGPNGAGKTTTMRMITGYLSPSEGAVRVGGHDMTDAPKRAKALIGYLPEQSPVYKDMRVGAFLSFAAEARGLSGQARRKAIDRVVGLCNLEQVLGQGVDTLSKGYLQRVCFAQALIHDPPVLILDEPTDGLDPNQKHGVRKLINEMGRDKTIIISTHILEEVEACCRRIIIISDGQVKADAPPHELMARCKTANTLVASFDNVDASAARDALGSLPGAARVDLLDAAPGAAARFRVAPAARDAVAGLAAGAARLAESKGWGVRELWVDKGRLDQVFRDITAPAS